MDAHEVTEAIYGRLCAMSDVAPPRLRLWDGRETGPDHATGTIILRHPGAMRALLVPATDLNAGEAYLFDDVDFEGDIFSVLEFAAGVESRSASGLDKLRLHRLLRLLPTNERRPRSDRPVVDGVVHSRRRDRKAVTHHYDTGNDFFETFLGSTMVYSCAYFLSHFETLERAQTRKLDVICRKLGVGVGTNLLDVGCGWGSLAVHAAVHYGAIVTGITLSEAQATYARAMARAAGVGDRVTIRVEDYRDITGSFDAVASVGMVEHVGRSKLGAYFRTIKSVLRPEGRFLNHGITTRDRTASSRRPTFVSTYVFPDGELLPIEDVLREAEGAGFEVRDVESLRRSYALTLRHWVSNLEANSEEAIAAAGERAYRTWRLYMAGSAIAFERAGISIYQSLLTDAGAPWRFGRAGLIADDDGSR